MSDRLQLAREIVEAHVPPAMASVVLEYLNTTPPPSTTIREELLTVGDAAAALSVHPSTVGRMIQRGELEYMAVGGRRRIRRSVVDAYLASAVTRRPRTEPATPTVRRSPLEAAVEAEYPWLSEVG